MKTRIKRDLKQLLKPAKLVIIFIGILVVTGLPQIAMQTYAQNSHINLIQSRNSMAVLAEKENRNNVQTAEKKNREDNSVGFQLTSERISDDKHFRVPVEKYVPENKD
jgi:hypothetical protein